MALRVDIAGMVKRLERKRSKIRADKFKPELSRYASKVLKTTSDLIPARSLSLIKTAQRKQYELRVNYIPTNHRLENPTLIVKPDAHWLYLDGKWHKASHHRLRAEAFAAYQDLLAEHERRLSTPRNAFVAERAQARFLYKRVPYEVAVSLGIPISVGADIQSAHSRHNPAKAPPKGYGQWRGGKHVSSIVAYMPLLEQKSRYIEFDGSAIFERASAMHRLSFEAEVRQKLTRLLGDN